MPPRVTNKTCITQVTLELINKGLLVDNRRLAFARFQMLFDLVVDKRGLDGFLNFLAQIQPILQLSTRRKRKHLRKHTTLLDPKWKREL